MARITIVTYGSLGDLHPAIALGLALQRRGHDAAIATSEPYRGKIAATGLRFHPVRPDLSLADESLVRRVMDGSRGTEFLLRDLVYPSVRDMYADLAPLAAATDLFLASELACAVPLVAATHRVPWAYFALSPISFLPVHDPCVLPAPPGLRWVASLGPAPCRLVLRMAKIVSYRWWRPVRALRRDLGLPTGKSPLFTGKYSPHLNLALFSSVLQPPQPDWPSNTVQTEFLFHDEASQSAALPGAVTGFLAAGTPPILFTLGSAAVHLAGNYYEESAAAAERLGRRAILLLGANRPPANLPPTVLAWDYLPFAGIFPKAAAIVHQGGVGTTAQAMRAGRPMLVTPFAHDQFDNAARVIRLKVGRQIARHRYHRNAVARELEHLLSEPGYEENAAAIGRRIRAEGEAQRTCDAIDALLKCAANRSGGQSR